MKLFFLIVLLIIDPKASAASTFFPFTFNQDKTFVIKPYEFNRYLKPQIKNIITEFYQVVSKYHLDITSLNTLYLSMTILDADIETFVKDCPTATAECKQLIKKMIGHLNKVERVLLSWSSLSYERKNEDSEKLFYPDRWLRFLNATEVLSTHSFAINNQLYMTLIGPKPEQTISINIRSRLMKDFLKIKQYYRDLLFSGLKRDLGPDFLLVYKNFIYPLHRFVLLKGSKDVLEKRMEGLNMAWNNFHKELVKGNSRPGPNIEQMMTIIHRRWNSILKVVLN